MCGSEGSGSVFTVLQKMSAISSCTCVERLSPFSPSSLTYPEWRDGTDNTEGFARDGYVIVRGLLSQEEVEETKQQISKIISDWYERFRTFGTEGLEHEEVVNRLPSVKSGESSSVDPELEVRKLYRIAAHFEFFAKQCCHSRIVSIINQLLGNDIKLLQSMALLKPPGSGEKRWHQDNAYFRLTPSSVIGCWIALDPASCANGCMHVLPSSHGTGLFEHGVPNDESGTRFIEYGMSQYPKPEEVIPVILEPGDALIFHGELAHYTPPNVSQLRRRSVQYHYAASSCKFIKCPRDEEIIRTSTMKEQPETKPHYFDCDPSCHEATYFHYRKAEVLVSGREYGNDYI